MDRRGRQAIGMRDGYLRGALSPKATQRQIEALAAFVAAGGSVSDAELVGIRPSTVKRHLADLRARSGLTTEQLIYTGRAAGWPGGSSSGRPRHGLDPRTRTAVAGSRPSRTPVLLPGRELRCAQWAEA